MHADRRTFDWSGHEHFARVSCDFNPIHMDETVARRTQPGAPIVHGIHSLIWLLDVLSRNKLIPTGARSLKVQFLQPIYVGDEVTLATTESSRSIVRARLLVGREEVVVASIGFASIQQEHLPSADAHALCMQAPKAARELRLEEMERFTGCLSFGPFISDLRVLFPAAVTTFGFHRIAGLACFSCLVGMVVPGLHSMFSGLELSLFEDGNSSSSAIRFAVKSVTQRFRLVRIGVRGQGIGGSLETVSRMPPVRQPNMSRLLSLVSKGEFRSSAALVVGGSRGLGELTGKLIAAGGGHVAITYRRGKADAECVAAEIREVGEKCEVIPFDVSRSAVEQLAALSMRPTQIYYFATPPIFRRKDGLFDARRFSEFNHFYLETFFDLVQACISLNPSGIRVFYPSSSAIEARPGSMTEYSMSKAAAEVLCADLSKFVPGVDVIARRLPRLPTDQTSSVVQAETVDPIKVMLPIVREMHQPQMPSTR